jgi:NitT/TauT family transport system substrate-binding protein
MSLGSARQPHAGGGPAAVLLLTAALTATLVTGCRQEEGRAAGSAPRPLRVGVLPDADALPIAAAVEDGRFAAVGLRVDLVKAMSAAERDQLLQAGELDGVVTDLVALCLYNRDAVRVRAVRHSMIPAPDRPQFRIMAAPGSAIRTPTDLAGRPVAVSEGTVVEYVVREALGRAGVPRDRVELVNVPAIPARMALLLDGKVAAAGLPEPLATVAQVRGARGIVDDLDHSTFCCSVLAFRAPVLLRRAHDVRRFLSVVDAASREINAAPEQWRRFALDRGMVPDAAAAAFRFMPYPVGSVPAAAVYDGVAAWLLQSGSLQRAPAYADVVTDTFLAGPPR